MTHFVSHYGIWVVFVLVVLESAGGAFVPGETAYIVACVLASRGHGSIVATVVATIAAAVLGTSAAFVLGRAWGLGILRRDARVERLTRPAIERTERLFRRHGAKALYLGRFIPVVRATLGWMAGVVDMPRGRFVLWNVAGAASWGCAIGLASYYVGVAVERSVTIGGVVLGALVVLVVGFQLLRRRLERA